MRIGLALFFLGFSVAAQAHIGSPNVFVEANAGDYPIRVVIRPANVVPGLAEITVRVRDLVERVTVLPVFSRAGREGAPPPDVAIPVRGETNLYSAQLWLMSLGAYSVDVTVEGPRGKGTLIVPVNAVATNTRPMARGYALMLAALGATLFVGWVKIANAIFGESRLEPGAPPNLKLRWQGRVAMLVAAGVLSLLLFVGKKWWDNEDRNYRNNALYQPFPASAQVRVERDQPILNLKADTSARRGRWTPLLPDHGKLMHLFLVRDGEPGAFAHLHPTQRSADEFEAPLPPLPAGRYHAYADVTHEDGFSETLVATAEIPAPSLEMKKLWLGKDGEATCSIALAQILSTNLFFPPDPDDSWLMESGAPASLPQAKGASVDAAPQIANASGGYKMIWENPEPMIMGLDASLRFKLLTPENQPAPIESYMGMSGHAVVRRDDGAVFAHIHPVGTISMAAQQFFVAGNPTNHSVLQTPGGAVSSEPAPLAAQLHASHTNQVGAANEISFPYAFPQPGAYRFWVQMKSAGRILTGVFDTVVAATR